MSSHLYAAAFIFLLLVVISSFVDRALRKCSGHTHTSWSEVFGLLSSGIEI